MNKKEIMGIQGMNEKEQSIHSNCEYYNDGVCLSYWMVYGAAWKIDDYNYCLGGYEMTELDYLKLKLKDKEKAFDKLHKLHMESLKKQGELEKEIIKLKKEKESWKGSACHDMNLKSMLSFEIGKLTETKDIDAFLDFYYKYFCNYENGDGDE